MTSNDGAPRIKGAASQLRQATNKEAFYDGVVHDKIRPELFFKAGRMRSSSGSMRVSCLHLCWRMLL